MSQEGKVKTTLFQKLEKFGDLFIINILFVISCIPIITIGAAFTAMYSYCTKLVKDQEAPVWKGYWSAFAKNFKPATKAWIVVIVILITMYVEYGLSFSLAGLGLAFDLGIMALSAVFLSFVLPLLFPLISRYENTTGYYFKNAFLLSVSHLGTWFYLFFLWVLPIALYASSRRILLYTWPLWLVILIGVIVYASCMVLVKLYDTIEQGSGEDSEAEGASSKLNEGRITKHLVDTSIYDDIDKADKGETVDMTDKGEAVDKTDEDDTDEPDDSEDKADEEGQA